MTAQASPPGRPRRREPIRKKRYGRIAGSGRNEDRRCRESRMTGTYLPIVSISASIDFCCSSVIQFFSRRIVPKSLCGLPNTLSSICSPRACWSCCRVTYPKRNATLPKRSDSRFESDAPVFCPVSATLLFTPARWLECIASGRLRQPRAK
jgi:hypothetical protein